jgi:hypothetical protein
MKVIQGNFERSTERAKSSEILEKMHKVALEAEKDGASLELVAVLFIEAESLQIVSNTEYPDGTYMLLNMASESIMQDVLTGG